MLAYLSIKNIVLIEKLELNFSQGFTVLTGETGAGKSIVVDALNLILGKRSEKRLIRKGHDEATVNALFRVSKTHKAMKFAYEHGFMIGDELILRRQILSNGRSQCFLNDEIISLSFMKKISSFLIEVHGQNDQVGLLDSSNHISILDDWDNLTKVSNLVANTYSLYNEQTKKLNKYLDSFSELELKKVYLNEDLEELIKLDIKDNEIEKLKSDRTFLMSVEKINDGLNNIKYYIQGDGNSKGTYENLSLAKKHILTILPLNNEKFKNLDESLDRAIIESKEVESALEDCLFTLEINNLNIEDIEKRISSIRQVARKHNVEINDLKNIKIKLQNNIANLRSSEDDIKKLEEDNKDLKENYINQANKLSDLRSIAAIKLSDSVNKEFPILKLDNAEFKISLKLLDEDKWRTKGLDSIIFEIETNKGTGFESIEKIASGGELSRIMLAIKVSLVNENDNSVNRRTLIFDEVDTGVGGAVADAIGKRLEILGKNNQVLAVTHHPQVAARSNSHFKVNKSTNNSFTSTSINNLEYKGRLEELARMLSGANITDAARNAAESLLQEKGI